jgi:GTP-binding protein HflX
MKGLDGGEFLLSDTVGFIQKLPHQLLKAFRATLMELKYADILIHVADSSNPNVGLQMDVVYKTLAQLGLNGKPVVTVYNKIDIAGEDVYASDKNAVCTVKLSALTGQGKEDLLKAIETQLKNLKTEITILIPYNKGELLNLIHKNGEVLSEVYEEEGTRVTAFVPPAIKKKLEMR